MPLKYTPKMCMVPKVEQITTPNKNVQSYFMRSDTSYYVDEGHRMASYRTDEPIVHVLVYGRRLIVESMAESIDIDGFFDLVNISTERFASLEEGLGWLGNRVVAAAGRLGIDPKRSFVSVVFHDLLSRTEILGLCNLFINLLSFKGVLVTPYSLSQAICVVCPSCVVVNMYETYCTVSLIEDFWVVDAMCVSEKISKGFMLQDSVDFVDEFNKVRIFEEKNIYWCDLCDQKGECLEVMRQHFDEMHASSAECHAGRDDHFRMHIMKYEESGDLCSRIYARLGYVLTKEKIKKIGSKVMVIKHHECEVPEEELGACLERLGTHTEIVVYEEPMDEAILGVMERFSNLDCIKEVWMTDKEWNSVGLRVLKEKVLFVV
ncbi:putative actin-like protein [Ordospora pajunii]|uniref:putative actin-like protein n=1 Tax=Ordospora pajunii TaxID=3039483 RepID=UPI002952723F|nr:putative actin-like protein [Ordospora pajunii]KAH9411156.1 putative actin-like protein [Ordospora pajunii]